MKITWVQSASRLGPTWPPPNTIDCEIKHASGCDKSSRKREMVRYMSKTVPIILRIRDQHLMLSSCECSEVFRAEYSMNCLWIVVF